TALLKMVLTTSIRALVCVQSRGYSISWQSSFFRVVGLGYYVDHCATGLQQIRFIPSFSASQA
ncbi:hypothetical protein, partial [Escherichia coli]|uniref:hypothetical protein n=1 Tax=Escherichia coli TaxID=562 RepID=UPI0008FB6B68